MNPTLTRRAVLGGTVGALGAAALAGCATGVSPAAFVTPTSAPVRAAERARRGTGTTVPVALTAAPQDVDLAGRTAATWTFGTLPAAVIRVKLGDRIEARLSNRLSEDTTIHWHGLALRNDMDGVPALTQAPVRPGADFTYSFLAPHAGTYWFHPHVGTQLDRGMYGALIIEDPNEKVDYDDEWVLILDDWLDGLGSTPSKVLKQLSRGMGSGGMGGMSGMSGMSGMGSEPTRMGDMLMGAQSRALGGDTGDVYYPEYLINGKPAGDPAQFTATPGRRIRLRMINAGGDTAFRVAVGGHRLTVTHSDGFPVTPTEATSVLLGMGERIDAIITLQDGVFPLVAAAEGKGARAFAVVRTGSGDAPARTVTVPELSGTPLLSGDLAATDAVRLPRRSIDRRLELTLSGSMEKYDWALNGVRYDAKTPLRNALAVADGERVQIVIDNRTSMWHPIHLHGHTWQEGTSGPRKDTSVVLPKRKLTVQFDADNPGRWAVHCHNIYHAESGMMGALAYRV